MSIFFCAVFSFIFTFFTSSHSPLQPAGLRHCNGAAFSSLKNLAALDVFNLDSIGTEPKDAPYATTGARNAESNCFTH
ncbi:MAG: hypothetical protein Q7T76_17940 [Ferruginibacter sp.]|nr:hypothetical protein [Ferruginibacter sp.]